MSDPMPPLQQLILSACERRQWRPVDLHKAMVARGVRLTLKAVCLWFNGGGVADKHRAILADVLGVSLNDLLRAAAGVEGAA